MDDPIQETIDLLNLELNKGIIAFEETLGIDEGITGMLADSSHLNKEAVSIGLRDVAMSMLHRGGVIESVSGEGMFPGTIPASEEDFKKQILEEAPEFSKRFEIICKLGSGGMGAVYEVKNRELNSRLAVKFLHHPVPEMLVGFKREFRFLSGLAHQNLVRLYQLFNEGGHSFFSMELIDGVDFLTWWRSIVSSESADSEDHTKKLIDAFLQLAEGIHALHSDGKLHRDVKPTNVLVASHDSRVVVLDFGLVTNCADRLGLFSPDKCDIAGTVPYMAPEQMTGEKLAEACDWYSFGVLAYEALMGERPFSGPYRFIFESKTFGTYDPLSKSIDPNLRYLVAGLLQVDPADRPGYDQIRELLTSGDSSYPTKTEPVFPDERSGQFFGREEQLEDLREGFWNTLEGRPGIATVHGISGMGKTSILEAFERELQSQDSEAAPLVLYGRCYEQESIPYKGIDEVIDQISGYLRQLKGDQLPQAVDAHFSSLANVFPALRLVGREDYQSPDPESLSSDPATQRRILLQALQNLFVELSEQKPIVIFLDDLQWADSGCIAVLNSLLMHSRKMRCFVVTSYRREEQNRESIQALRKSILASDRLDSIDVPVNSLSSHALKRLANLYAKEFSGEIDIDKMVENSKGSPYFLMQLVTAAGQGHHDISLDSILGYRFKDLKEEEQNYLEMIAVAGRPIIRKLALEAAGILGDEYQIESSLRTSRWIKSSGPEVDDFIELYHDRIRKGVVDLMDRDVKREHHDRIAQSLQSSFQEDHEHLAFHFLGAEKKEEAGTYYAMAGDSATRSLAFDQAVEFYEKSIECLDLDEADPKRIGVEELRAQALSDSGNSAQSAAAFSSLASNPHVTDKDSRVFLRKAANNYLVSGYVKEGSEALNQVLLASGIKPHRSPQTAFISLLYHQFKLSSLGLQFIPKEEDKIPPEELEAIDTLWAATLGYSLADVIRATDFQFQCCIRALKSGDRSRLTRSLAHQAIQSAPAGPLNSEVTAKYLNLAKDLAEKTGTNTDLGIVAIAKAAVGLMEGRYRDCYENSRIALNLAQNQKSERAWRIGYSLTYQLWSLVTMGEVAELRDTLPDILSEAEKRGDLHTLTIHKSYAAPLLLMWDDEPERAIQMRDNAIESWPAEGFYAQHLVAMIARAEIMLYQGDELGALDFFEKLKPAYRKSFLPRVKYGDMTKQYLEARCALSAIVNGKGDRKKLARLVERNCGNLLKMKQPCSEAMVACLKGTLLRFAGDTPGAEALLESAAIGFKKHDLFLHRASILWTLPDHRDEAEKWFENQGVVNPERVVAGHCPTG